MTNERDCETGPVIRVMDVERDAAGLVLVLTREWGAEVVVDRLRLGTGDSAETARLLETAARSLRARAA